MDHDVGDPGDSSMILDAGASKMDVVLALESRLGKRTGDFSTWQLTRICVSLP